MTTLRLKSTLKLRGQDGGRIQCHLSGGVVPTRTASRYQRN